MRSWGESSLEDTFQNIPVDRKGSIWLRLAGAFVFANGLYSLLFFIYVALRITFNPEIVHLNDLFIDYIPFFTFYITGVLMLAASLVSFLLYAAIRYYSGHGSVFRRPGGGGDGYHTSGKSLVRKLSYIGMLALVAWSISTSIWAYVCFLILSNPISYFTVARHHPIILGWHVAIVMFVISYFSMILMHYKVSQR